MGRYSAIDYSQGGSLLGGVNDGLTTGLRLMQTYQAGKNLRDDRKKGEAAESAAAATPTEEVGREQAMAGAQAAYQNALTEAGDDPAKRQQVEAEYAPVFAGVQSNTPETPRYRLGDVVANQPLSPDQLGDARLGLQQQHLASSGLADEAFKVGHDRQTMRGSRLQEQIAQRGLNRVNLEDKTNQEIAAIRTSARQFNERVSAAGGLDALAKQEASKANGSGLPVVLTPEARQARMEADARAKLQQEQRQNAPDAVAMRSADAMSPLDAVKAMGLEKSGLDMAKEQMASAAWTAYGSGGLEAALNEYEGFNDGISAPMTRDAKGNAIIAVTNKKTGKIMRYDTVPNTREAETAYIAQGLAHLDQKTYLESMKLAQTARKEDRAERAQTAKEKADSERGSRDDRRLDIAEKRADAAMRRAEVQSSRESHSKAPAEIQTAEWLVENGVAADAKAAYSMVKKLREKSDQDIRLELIKGDQLGTFRGADGEKKLLAQVAMIKGGATSQAAEISASRVRTYDPVTGSFK